eukprot:TCALIF_07520-PA protein Name:"Similar to PTGR1 Prostaglandin reductase 1 (Homo sapiens)" AED:0.13 eAED:0.13 QI:0/0.75/0.55/1/0.87/0.88/9/0/834
MSSMSEGLESEPLYMDGDYLNEYYDNDYPEPLWETVEDSDPTDDPAFSDHDQPWKMNHSLEEILEYCVQPTVRDAGLHIGKVVLWAGLFRLATQLSPSIRPWMRHTMAVITGLIAAAHFFYTNVAYLVCLACLSYLVLVVSHGIWGHWRGPLMTVTCLGFNLVAEFWLATPVDWHQIRGAQMILTMKMISLGFDFDRENQRLLKADREIDAAQAAVSATADSVAPGLRMRDRRAKRVPSPTNSTEASQNNSDQFQVDYRRRPTFFEHMGYAINPGTTVFGPWITYHDYMASFHRPKWNLTWLVKIVLCIVYGFMFLTISTCWNPWMIPDGVWRWWTAYRDAMSFRASHYFVSYISEATAVAAGFGLGEAGDWNLQVVHPHNIEVPRSLTEVVKSWNIPMHVWLKTYCFKVTRRFGTLVAVLTTYLASTMLHGLNFQLGAVLLSLGIYTFAEFKLRARLAEILQASVHASRVWGQKFKYPEGSMVSISINFIFGMLACFNLAYLGVMFNQDASMEDFEIVSEELGDLEDGDIITETEFISVDPYQRPYSRTLTPPTTMMGSQVAKVIESKDPNFPVGSRVVSHTGWVERAKINPSKLAGARGLSGLTKAPEIGSLSPSLLLGACGMPGNTAYFGFLEICEPKKGENVFINGAAGAVGSLVGQIAKIKGCKVVGSAGTDEKVKWLTEECGFDYAFNYKKVSITEGLEKGFPSPAGIDCFFENVGGPDSSVVLSRMNTRGRVSVCGSISTYNDQEVTMAPSVQGSLVTKELKMEGFLVPRWKSRWNEGIIQMAQWIKEGQIKPKETILNGFEKTPEAFIGLFTGDNMGKMVVQVGKQ